MGVTVHYEGTLRSARDLDAVIAIVCAEAEAATWSVERVIGDDVVLERVIDEEERDYHGPVTGVVVHPHADAEPLHFVFGDDLFMQDYCKTQFAGLETHVAVIALLHKLAPHFESLAVFDEGEFWDTADATVLQSHFHSFEEALSRLISEHPKARV